MEFSLRSRGEALTIRASLASKSFLLSGSETTSGSVVSDTIRRMDFECSRYAKLIATLPSHVDSTGLSLPEGDMLLMLLKSLPVSVRDFCLHHSTGENFAAYRTAARRWEEQQRLFQDSQIGLGKKLVSQVEQWSSENHETEWYSIHDSDDWNSWGVRAVTDPNKCTKCGSKKHRTSDCGTDLSKVRCFRCSGMGHVGANCPGKGVGSSSGDAQKGKSKGKGKDKRGKGFARKGKLNEVSEASHEDWWWSDQDWGSYESEWYVDQVYDWNEHEWNDDSWNSTWTEQDWKANEGTPVSSLKPVVKFEEKPKEEKPVGSLILSPIFCEDVCETPFFTLKLDLDSESEEMPHVVTSPQPFLHPQPFLEGFELVENLEPVNGLRCEKLESGSDLQKVFPVSGQRGLSKGEVCEVFEKGFFEGLIADEPFRTRRLQIGVSTFLNECDTVSADLQLRRYSTVMSPLLSQLAAGEDIGWWLLDSGAAVTVLAKHCVVPYGAELVGDVSDLKFTAANGSGVSMLGRCELSVFMCLWNHDENHDVWKKAKLTALIGDTRHNILSTTSLTQSGWRFLQQDGHVVLTHDKSGCIAHEIVVFAGCPWVRLHPHSGLDRLHEEVDLSCAVEKEGSVCPLSKSAKEELEQHRNQGHTPHNPHCLECARGRTTHSHRRRKGDTVETEVQADFGFLSQHGEVSEVERSGAVRVLVLTELLSGAIGYVVVGDDLSKSRGLVSKWLQHFGVENETCSVILHTDAEQAVRSLVTSSTSKIVFQVRKARNQQHQSIGGAERSVRRLRETLAILRADLNQAGWDIRFEYEHLQEALTYLALSHNHFGKSRESDFSPLEMIAERRLTKPTTALFGSTVLAELPTSLEQRSPNETRSIEASFLHVGIDHGPVVQGKLRVDGQRCLAQFAARNVRQITPISWKKDLCDSFLIPFQQDDDSGEVPAIGDGNRPPDAKEALEFSDLPPVLEPPPSVRNPLLDAKVETRRHDEIENRTDESEPKREFKRLRRASDTVYPPESKDQTYIFTRGCPSCESGMNVPGIRHSARCRRINQAMPENKVDNPVVGAAGDSQHDVDIELDVSHDIDPDASPSIAPDSPLPEIPDVEIPQEEEFRERSKRKHEGDVGDIDHEVKRERVIEVENDMQLGLFWEDTVDSVDTILQVSCLFKIPATKPTMLLENLSSIKFEQGVDHGHQLVDLGGGQVLVWKPSSAVDDSTLADVNVDQCFEGMVEEITNMQKCRAGKLLSSTQVDAVKQAKPQARIIQARWVVARKSDVKVRARVVAKDIRKSLSARQLGYSSPTPSTESLSLVLAYAAMKDARLKSLDVSHAFMHSPLPSSETIILRLPQSVSLKSGAPAFLHLERALNGLRDASLHWMNLLASTIRHSGLWNDENEPCVYQGSVSKYGSLKGLVSLIVYVDDILLVASSKEAEEVVIDSIKKVVPTKITGSILPSDEGGGALTFIGRQIHRRSGESAIYLSVDPNYLNPSFDDYQIKRGTAAVPDVSSHLEKQDEQSLKQLTPEGYSKFRKALGKLLWLSQTRRDAKLWLSLIGSLQAAPTCGADNAVKAVLRFLYQDRHLQLRLPSQSWDLTADQANLINRLHVLSDASHAPYRFSKRKGISGEVMSFQNSVIRTVAKQQQSTSLSSCEAELYAIQAAAQDSVSMSKFLYRYLFGLGEIDEMMKVDLWLESDSMSAIQLLHGVDLPRRSRHVGIRVLWMKSKIEDGSLQLHHRYGESNCSDLFTKCLGTRDFMRHRATLGFEGPEQPISSLVLIGEEDFVCATLKKEDLNFAFFEICCQEESCLRKVCEQHGVPYVGVSENMQQERVLKMFYKQVKHFREHGFWLHVHVSTPCKTGSPLKHFQDSGLGEDENQEWKDMMQQSTKYLLKGDSRSFELPSHNGIWKRGETVDVLEKTKLEHTCEVFLCQTDVVGSDGLGVGKTLMFKSNVFPFCQHLHKKFGTCNCVQHSPFSKVDFNKTGFYNLKLSDGILKAAILSMLRN